MAGRLKKTIIGCGGHIGGGSIHGTWRPPVGCGCSHYVVDLKLSIGRAVVSVDLVVTVVVVVVFAAAAPINYFVLWPIIPTSPTFFV